MRNPLKVLLIAAGIVLVVVVAAWLIANGTFSSSSGGPYKPGDTIYMSLNAETAPASGIGLYAYHPNERSLETFVTGGYYGLVYSSDGSDVAYARMGPASIDIYAGPNIASSTPVTSNNSVLDRKSPAWSPDKSMIAYMGHMDPLTDPSEPNAWYIYTTDFKTRTESFVTNGSNPVFTSDGSLLVLKDDGLWRMDLATLAGGRLWEASSTDMASSTFGLSRDGNYLAWSTPANRTLNIVQVTSWRPFTTTSVRTISVSGYTPVFSPDGEWIALKELDSKGAHLVEYNVKSGQKKTLFNFGSYDANSGFVTDWR